MLFSSAITANAAQEDLFDAEYYAETYPDVVAVYGNDAETLLQQYLDSGITEGRSANAYFNALVYRTVNTDLAAAFGDDWDAYADHYIEYGVAEGRYTGGTRAITDEEYAAAVAKMSGSTSTIATESSAAESSSSTNSSGVLCPYELNTIYYDNLGYPYVYCYEEDKFSYSEALFTMVDNCTLTMSGPTNMVDCNGKRIYYVVILEVNDASVGNVESVRGVVICLK